MKHQIFIVAVTLAMTIPCISAQTPATEEVIFKDQIRQFVMNGDDTDKVDVTLTLSADSLVVTPKKKGAAVVSVPYATVSGMTYDRRSRVRKMFIGTQGVSKAEDHFLTIQYKPESGPGGFVEIEMGKDTAPRILATLEARSGKTIQRSAGS